MRRRQALGAIGAILAAAVAPAFIPSGRIMPLKLIREATPEEIKYYVNPNSSCTITYAKRQYLGWEFAYTHEGRDYYRPTHPALIGKGELGVAPTPLEMEGLGIDPDFARPVFVPNEKQFVDHQYPGDPK